MLINFDIRKAKNFNKIAKGKLVNGPLFTGLYYFSIVLAFVLIIVVLFADSQSGYARLGKVLLGIIVLYPVLYQFLKFFYTPSADIASANIAEGLSEEMSKVVSDCVLMSEQNKFSTIEPIMLLAAFEKNSDGKYMLMRAGFGLEKDISGIIARAVAAIVKSGGEDVFSVGFLEVMEAAKANAVVSSRLEISSGDILLGLIQKSDIFQKIMFDVKIDENDIKTIVEWHEFLKRKSSKYNLPFWEKEGIVGGIGKDWSFGYTPTLSQFARNLNDEVLYAGEVNVYGRDREIDEIERVLSKSSQNNVLLVGDHGIGKKTIVKGFVSRVLKGKTLPSLRYMQIFQVDTGALLSGGGQSGEIAMRIKKVFNEAARAGNIILFFDNFHALVSKKEGVGQVDTSEVILPYLAGAVKVIGATSLSDYHKNVEASPGVASAMNRVDVREPNPQDTIKILEEMVPYTEHRDGVFWPYQSLRESVSVAQRYIHNKPFPEKSIEIIDEVSVEVAKAGQKIVFTRDIDNLVSRKLEVPVAQAEGEEAKKLLNLEAFLHERVIGQDQAIKAVASAMRRARAGVQSKQRPIGSFLFLGPTGVGKTETSKALAEAYFGSEKNMIRVDMSEKRGN
jgi:ATP-dependent Clp protease ATP-binding subunit ClpC